jgi:serine/threonine protein kinase
MHAHGYVHRDVSSGNIIFHGGEGKIADLEYAKEIGTGSGHNERTVCPSSHDTGTLTQLDA